MVRLESIKNLTYTKDLKIVDSNTKIKNLLKSLKVNVDSYLYDNRYYNPITAGTPLSDRTLNSRAIAFKVSQDPDNLAKHMLEVSVLHPKAALELTRPLAYGDKKAILGYLNDEKSFDGVMKEVKEMCEEFNT